MIKFHDLFKDKNHLEVRRSANDCYIYEESRYIPQGEFYHALISSKEYLINVETFHFTEISKIQGVDYCHLNAERIEDVKFEFYDYGSDVEVIFKDGESIKFELARFPTQLLINDLRKNKYISSALLLKLELQLLESTPSYLDN